jgi:predicted dithiol-disulfide oxidoreductase (DUF899 family)
MMATIAEVAEIFGITENQVNDLRLAMSRTWGQVRYDYIECFEGGETEMYALFDNNEASLIAEATIDADRVTTFCPEMDLGFVYQLEDGSYRMNCIKMAEACWDAR